MTRVGARVLVVQHEDQCPPAWVGDWLLAAGCVVDVRRPYADQPLPIDLTDHDAMVVLGGPMGANDDQYAWIPETKRLVREAAEDQVPTLGICLGHQLCAVALGGAVGRNPLGQQLGLVESGWLPAADADPLVGPMTEVRHGVQWNDDIVLRLPETATLLAATPAGEPQVVRFAPTVWGVQLHPEADDRVIAPWAEADRPRYDDDRVDLALQAVAAARDELERDWRPLAESLAEMAGHRPHSGRHGHDRGWQVHTSG
ncbi:MAG: type 1 glutamine amidotransferase [Actinomycetota bacterium]|nr:type 1 glutamine amidotransferase [Actinomycetota bacterium]